MGSSGHGFKRRAVRRAARTECQAVGMEGFRLLGDRVLDLSPEGMLVACDSGAQLGEEVLVSFLAPGRSPQWMDAEASIARIIYGYRPGDPGYCVGLEFDYFERSARNELLTRLAGVPPPVPRRRIRTAEQRLEVAEQRCEQYGPVIVHGIIPLTNRKVRLPAGVFAA